MEKRVLGRTGLEVSALGMGGIGFIKQFRTSREDSLRVIRRAIDSGVNFIETARAYFDSEEIIGEALSEGDRRQKCIIATKSYLRSAEDMEKEVERSLKALATDHIEIFQIHHIQYLSELEEVTSPRGAYQALKSLQKAGVIDFIGVTSHNPEVLAQCAQTGLFDTVQFPLNPAEEELFNQVYPWLKKLNIGSIVMKPLMGGRIANVEAALAFALSFEVSTVIPGIASMEELETDLRVARNFAGLSAQEREALKAEVKKLPEEFCRRCRYCDGVCPEKIKISEVFRCEEYLIFNATFARNEFRRLDSGLDKCRDCGKCEEICPYHLPIRKKLKTARLKLEAGRMEDWVVNLTRKLGIYDKVRKLYFDLVKKIPER